MSKGFPSHLVPGDDRGPFVPDRLQHWSWERAQTQVQWGWGWVKFEASVNFFHLGWERSWHLIKYSQDFTNICDCVIQHLLSILLSRERVWIGLHWSKLMHIVVWQHAWGVFVRTSRLCRVSGKQSGWLALQDCTQRGSTHLATW